MPPAHYARTKAQKLSEEQEEKIRHVCSLLSASDSPNICAAATEHKIPYHTLQRQYLGKSQSYHNAHTKQQILSPTKESVLVDWIKHLSSMGQPLSK
ncbi:hypothetical protein V8B97DRAFT_1867420 [Scleroderma yunnanense]